MVHFELWHILRAYVFSFLLTVFLFQRMYLFNNFFKDVEARILVIFLDIHMLCYVIHSYVKLHTNEQ